MFKDLLVWMKKLCNQIGTQSLVEKPKPAPVKKPVARKKPSVKKTQPVLAKRKPAVKKAVKK